MADLKALRFQREWDTFRAFATKRPRSDDGKYVVVVDDRVFGPSEDPTSVRQEAELAFPNRGALVIQLAEGCTEPIFVRASRY